MAILSLELGATALSVVGGLKVGAALKPIAEAGVKAIAANVPELAANPQVVEAGAKALAFCAGVAGSVCVHKVVYDTKDAVEFGIDFVKSYKEKKQKQQETKEEKKEVVEAEVVA